MMINYLDINNASLWTFVDYTTTSEVVKKGQPSRAQAIADEVSQWSTTNRVQLNSDKCKELRISFSRNQREFSPVMVDNKSLEVVHSAKLLGLTISSCNLNWNAHISEIVKKASKRIYFLVQLKRALEVEIV